MNHPAHERWLTACLALLLPLSLTSKDYDHYSEWIVASEMSRVPHPYNLDFSPSKPRWAYQVGIELDGMLDVYLRYGDEQVAQYLQEYPARMIDSKGNITGYSYKDFNLDNVRPGHFLLRYYQQWPTEKERLALDLLFQQLENQPRTEEGVWWHKAIYARQVWLDGIFMGLPFYTAAAPLLRQGKEQSYYDDAVSQILTTDARTYDATTRLCNFIIDSCDVYSVSDVPRETLVEIGEMLVKAKVQNWESSYTNRDVFDGDSWSMDVKFGKDLIWSGGYMAWPDNDPTREINKIICNLCKPQKGESESRQ